MHTSTLAAALLAAMVSAKADWALPAGAAADLGGGTVSMGCSDLSVSGGTLALGTGGALVAARDVSTSAGSSLALNGGRVELAGQWTSTGPVNAGNGQVLRVASPGCLLAGPAGPIPLGGGAAPVPVPALSPWALALLTPVVLALAGRRRRATAQTQPH
ncbi:hypothetical protein [Acidovorax kalamii]|uniref:hypothetical protein n=1 Tax=Acidovorax kalamii TaxID=2004485 RepID=UPI00209138EE|nr:hypothetical protein [Acidovorax kalamii]MCO5356863.1 hypothetical protein [Acidovorax kalamii]